MTSSGSADGSGAPPDLESLPPVVRAVLGDLQQAAERYLHQAADRDGGSGCAT
ncbi:MAG: hypothetical protein ACRDRZ_11965 [Pseudonocardiaceae bacterium]